MLNNEKEWSFDYNNLHFAKFLLNLTRELKDFFICNKVLHSEKVRKNWVGPAGYEALKKILPREN